MPHQGPQHHHGPAAVRRARRGLCRWAGEVRSNPTTHPPPGLSRFGEPSPYMHMTPTASLRQTGTWWKERQGGVWCGHRNVPFACAYPTVFCRFHGSLSGCDQCHLLLLMSSLHMVVTIVKMCMSCFDWSGLCHQGFGIRLLAIWAEEGPVLTHLSISSAIRGTFDALLDVL